MNINYSIFPKRVMCRMIKKFRRVSNFVAWFIRFTKNVELMFCDHTALVDPSHREPNNHIIIMFVSIFTELGGALCVLNIFPLRRSVG